MSAFDDVLGQEVAVRVLDRAIADGRVASAYLFEGPSGVGKQRAALALACALVAKGDAHTRERVLAGTHPDVRVFRPRDEGSRNLQVEFIREQVIPFTQFAPFESEAAFVVFPEADVSFPENHPEAANALLKTLEEPKARLHFVLLAERPDRLLTTIRSRCQRLRFAPLGRAALERILAREGISDEAAGPAIALAQGRADRALELAAEGRAESLLETALYLHDATMTSRPGLLVEAAERLAKLDEHERSLVLEALATLYRDLAALNVGLPNEALHYQSSLPTLHARAMAVSVAGLSERERLVRRVDDALARNANPQTTFDALVHELRRHR